MTIVFGKYGLRIRSTREYPRSLPGSSGRSPVGLALGVESPGGGT